MGPVRYCVICVGLVLNQSSTRSVPLPGTVGPFDALVAAPGFSDTSIFTSPNQQWVPDFAIAHSEITTYSDGRWGAHEYSRWPQVYDHAHRHVACIPRPGSVHAPKAEILWRVWERGDWRTKDCGVARYGQLFANHVHELSAAAEAAIEAAQRLRCPPNSGDVTLTKIRHFLVICLRHCVDRLRLLPGEQSVIISLASHIQRLTLELVGLKVYVDHVYVRLLEQGDWSHHVLEVLGAWSGDPSVVQTLHRAGIPVWFQQHFTPKIAVWSVVPRAPLPFHFSSQPSYPRLVLAARDISGSLNTPGEWQRAMDATVRRQLCSSRLPDLLHGEMSASDCPPPKRLRADTARHHGSSASTGAPRATIVPRASQAARTLAHGLRTARPDDPTRPKPRVLTAGSSGTSRAPFLMNPFRQYYRSMSLEVPSVWAHALQAVSPLPQPRSSVVYFFPPPWMLDDLVDYTANADKVHRYLHHLASIRTFCRTRLFDHSIAGRPLTISEWRDALWGDYSLDEPDKGADDLRSNDRLVGKPRSSSRHALKQSLRRLFGRIGSLPSYQPASAPLLGDVVVTLHAARTNPAIRRRLVWEAYETNWRCELLALDALMVGSNELPEMQRWTREAHVSEVWGPSRSGLALCPDVDRENVPFCWAAPTAPGWERSCAHLRAFAELLARWPGCPQGVWRAGAELSDGDEDAYVRVQSIAVAFYVETFVRQYDRLPTPPALFTPERLSPVDITAVSPVAEGGSAE